MKGDMSFPAVSIGEASQRGSPIARCQAMLPGSSGEHQTTREMDSNAITLEKRRGVYRLPGMVTETLTGVPLSSNPETASTVVEETVIPATDPDITTQLEGSEETQDITTQGEQGLSRCTSGCTLADQIMVWKGTHGGETKMHNM